MVHYIRFLKPPKFDIQKCIVRALITITTDLGDDFYPSGVTLYAALISGDTEDSTAEWQKFHWKGGIRNIWIEIRNVNSKRNKSMRLLVTTQRTVEPDNVLLDDLPDIFSAWSEVFGRDDPQAGNKIERRYRTALGNRRAIFEETGESIARHIWDAGVVLAAFFSNIIVQPEPTSLLATIFNNTSRYELRVLELGSGCGIVGLEVAQICQHSDVFLTDLPAAMEILNFNVHQVTESGPNVGNMTTATLDWDDTVSMRLRKHQFDLLIFSDCTYNSDSIPALVETLAILMDTSPDASAVVSMKVRHDSEAIFFDLIGAAGLVKAEHCAITLPDRQRADSGVALEFVDIYVFSRNNNNKHSYR